MHLKNFPIRGSEIPKSNGYFEMAKALSLVCRRIEKDENSVVPRFSQSKNLLIWLCYKMVKADWHSGCTSTSLSEFLLFVHPTADEKD